MHVASGARLAEVTARCVLAHALSRDGDLAAADLEWRTGREVLDELAVPDTAPVRRLLDPVTASSFPLIA
jgi:hypothetical protein